MSSFFSNYDLSILAIPAYYMLAMLPHGMAVHVATQGKLDRWDNRNPRSTTMKAKLKERLPADIYDKYERLESCHINGIESFPLFASAVVLGNLAGLERDEMVVFVASFLAVRVAYTVVYVTHTTQSMATFRTTIWYVAIVLCFRTIFRAAGASRKHQI